MLYKLYMLSELYTSPISLDLASRMMTWERDQR